MKLEKNDQIITAYAESSFGPGWSNQPVWVIIRNALSGEIRKEAVQPSEQTAEMLWLYGVSAAAHRDMTAAVQAAFSINNQELV